MPSKAVITRFLEDLAQTLDIKKTIRNLKITEDDARRILKGLSSGGEKLQRPGDELYNIYVDGASRGNPGRAGAGAVIKDGKGRVVKKLRRNLGITTNNMAEYSALIMALEGARKLGLKRIRVFADSELLVKQINGQYRVKSEDLRPLFMRAVKLLEDFEDTKITHIKREDNPEADRLANEAIDNHH